MKKLPIFVITFLIALLMCAFASTQVKAAVLTITISPTSWVMDVGQSKVFNANASGGLSYLYQWSVNGNTQSETSSTFSYTATATGPYSISVTVTDISSGATGSSSASVTVSNAPTVSISPVGPVTMNVGQTQVFNATGNGGSGSLSYQWYLDGGAVGSNSASYSYSANATGSNSVTCKVTDSASVPVTSSASNAVSVTVNAAVTVNVAPTSWVMDIGQSKMFTATASGGSTLYSYQWYVNGSPQSGATSSTYTYSATSAGSYSITVTVIDNLGTTGSSSPTTVTVNTQLTVNIVPAGLVNLNVGQIQVFNATTIGGSGTLSYQWYLNGSAVGNAASYSFSVTSTGTYIVTCNATDSASSPVTVTSNVVTVKVNTALTAPTVSASPSTITQGQTSSLTSTAVTTGSSPYTYQWFQRGPGASSYSIISGATLASCSFVTSDSTVTGDWSFILQVTDAANQAVNSSAVKVTLNYAPVDHFIFGIVSNQTAGTNFEITITAKDASNNTLTYYNGINTLSVSNGTIFPTTTDAFSNGVWTGSVMVTQTGSEIKLLTSGSGMTGVSNYFIVNPSVLDHFSINTVTGTFTNGSSFNITVTAQDKYNNTVTSYIGKPSLAFSAGTISPSVMKAFVKGVGSTLVTINATGSNGTILVQDGIYTGISNLLTLNTNPTSLQPVTPYESMLAIGIAIPEIILIFIVIASKHLKQKPENS